MFTLKTIRRAVIASLLLGATSVLGAPLTPASGDIELHDFAFGDGEHMPSLRLHYLTLGTPKRDANGKISNGVLLLHGTTGSAETMTVGSFANPLYGPGAPLDADKYFLVIPDGIGAGHSSKPSDGLHARFPRYGYNDQVRAQHDLLAAIGITHLKLVLGTSMGGMQTWLWGQTYPEEMDALVAVASTPAAISGRNMMWREMISQAIRNDPDWKGGDYPSDKPPRSWGMTAVPLFTIMTGNADHLQKDGPTRSEAVAFVRKLGERAATIDANDYLYVFESSADYDPAPKLGAIVKPMLTINFADDLLNPPDLLGLPTAANFTKVMLPGGAQSYGHQTLTQPRLWAPAVASFLASLPSRQN